MLSGNIWDSQKRFPLFLLITPLMYLLMSFKLALIVLRWRSSFCETLKFHEATSSLEHGIWGSLNLWSWAMVIQLCLQNKLSLILLRKKELC